jgi:WD40 repeat protein
MARVNTTGPIDLIDTRTGASQRAAGSETLPPSELGPTDPVVAFSPDGTLLAGWFPNGTVDLWDATSATLIAQLEPRNGDKPATSAVLQFDKLGNELSLITHNANDTSTIQRWSLGPDDLIAEACRLAGSSLTRQEWNRFVGRNVPYHQTCAPDAGLR